MRRLLILALLGLLLGAGLVALIEQDPGHLLLSFGSTTVETSLWVGLLLWVVAWWLLAVVWRTLRSALSARTAMAGWLGGRKSRNAEALTNRGLISFIEGNWARSRKQLLRAARYSKAPLLNYLMAARASFRLEDLDGMRRYLGSAESVESDAVVALELTQAELQLSAGRYEQALATLVRARRNADKHPYVLELLAKAYSCLQDWDSLQELLPELRKHQVIPAAQLQALELQTWDALLARIDANTDDAEANLSRLWQAIPSALEKAAPLLKRRYLQRLVVLGAYSKAERILFDSLERQWNGDLVCLVGAFPVAKPEKTAKILKRWLEQQRHEPTLMLAAGRIALQANLWDEAQQYLQSAYQLGANAEICVELARLRAAQGDSKRAQALLQEAVTLCVGDLPALPLPTK
mgnify:CR=1 FL=1